MIEPDLLPKYGIHFLVVEAIRGKRESLPLMATRILKFAGGCLSNVFSAYELKSDVAHLFHDARHHLTHEVGSKVVDECDWTEDSLFHSMRTSCCVRNQVFLDVVFGDQMRNDGWVAIGGFLTSTVGRCEDEVLDAVGYGGIYHLIALFFFVLASLGHTEDSPDLSADFPEDGVGL